MKQSLKPIMFVGTGSDVGKSVLNAGFCRIFLQDGYQPAPFKAQNMSLNSYVTPDGLEIGRAQAMQAEASGIDCRVEMNPILLKPTSNKTSQVVLNGKPAGNQSARSYFFKTDRQVLFREAIKAYQTLADTYNPIVIEGAGSISEINLWDKDITNMKIAVATQAATYLVADIDRGGVFGSVYGTLALLPEEERALIKGIVINKFRGDLSLFDEGRKMLYELTKVPVAGVIPYFRDIYTEQEDSVVIDNKKATAQEGKINIAVVLLPRMSNFTDFDNLEFVPEVHLYYAHTPDEIAKADIIMLPGSKNTIEDLEYLKEKGIDLVIKKHVDSGKQLYGICGGYQMMGREIRDPYHVETTRDRVEGLDLLPLTTTLTKTKKTEQTQFTFLNTPQTCSGYEIHMGETQLDAQRPLCTTAHGVDGFMLNDKVWGTYIHGIFDNAVVVEHILKQINPGISVDLNYKAFKDKEYDKLAALIRASVDMDYIYSTL
ncbi:MAG: cobyric acid synthase CobQ [Flavobacteriia bacterium]|nr:MAG: cobyric acid synthase CobQ [Flavobacteriia bacterium]